MPAEPLTGLPAEGIALLAAHFDEAPTHGSGRAQLFEAGGVKVLMRTSCDFAFPTTATDPDLTELDIERHGAHFVLFVTPTDRYLVPVKVAAGAYRKAPPPGARTALRRPATTARPRSISTEPTASMITLRGGADT